MIGEAEQGKSAPRVSVCIANYNGERLLDACLASVYAQGLADNVEILVHDDASTDGSLQLLRERHPHVRVIESDANVGYCISNNRMAEQARGEFLLLLNNDAALRPGALQSLVDAAEYAPWLSIFTVPQFDWDSGALVDRGVRMDFLHTPVPNSVSGCERLAYVQGACLFIRRCAWMQLGGFPEWMVSNVEDFHLCLVARLKGGDVTVVESSGYDHRQGTSFGGNRVEKGRLATSYRRRYLSERNRACLVLVCTPTWAAWPCFVLHLGALMFEGALFAAVAPKTKAWSRIYWPAIREPLGLLATLREARKRAQLDRVLGFWAYLRLMDWIPQKLRVLIRHGVPSMR